MPSPPRPVPPHGRPPAPSDAPSSGTPLHATGRLRSPRRKALSPRARRQPLVLLLAQRRGLALALTLATALALPAAPTAARPAARPADGAADAGAGSLDTRGGGPRAADARGARPRALLGLAPGARPADLAPALRAEGARVLRWLDGSRVLWIEGAGEPASLRALAAEPGVAWAVPDRWVRLLPPAPPPRAVQGGRAEGEPRRGLAALGPSGLLRRPDDPLLDLQWHHAKIGSEAAWARGDAEGMVIAIVDTGVDCAHPDLAGRCLPGYDYVNDDDDPMDDNGHGTIEAGVAAAITNNGEGVAGLAWGARILPLKAMGGSGGGSIGAIVSSIEHAVDGGADVINLSLGTGSPDPALQAAVEHAAREDVFVAAAGGNSNVRAELFPAGYPEVVGVGGTRQSDTHPPFNTGPHIEVSAPGWEILTTRLGDGYEAYHGTSEATPLVAGLAALLRAAHPDWTVPDLRARIAGTAEDLGEPGWDETFGWGRIDADRATDPELVLTPPSTQTPRPSPSSSPSPSPTSAATPTPTPPPALLLPWLGRDAALAR